MLLQTPTSTGHVPAISVALVEPNPRPSLLTLLTNAGYKVQSYSHPLQAMEGIVDRPVAVALIAPELPWMSGSALVRTLRDSYRVPEVLLIDNDMSEEAILARVRAAAPIEAPRPEARTRRAPDPNPAAASRGTGRRILIRTARPR